VDWNVRCQEWRLLLCVRRLLGCGSYWRPTVLYFGSWAGGGLWIVDYGGKFGFGRPRAGGWKNDNYYRAASSSNRNWGLCGCRRAVMVGDADGGLV
jgi:hypothetical protein